MLSKWLQNYRKGKYDCGNIFLDISSKSLAKKAKLVPRGHYGDRGAIKPGEFSYRDEIILLCEQAAATNGAAAAQILLQVAAIGLDDHYEYTSAMSPVLVRGVGEQYIARFNSSAARDYFVVAARGEPVGPEKIKHALQAAAIKVLARFEDAVYIPIMMEGVSAPEALVRSHAVDGIKMLGPAMALKPVIDAFEREESEVAQIAMVQALERIYFVNEGQVDQDLFLRGLQRAIKCLGTGDWQTDVAMIQFLKTFPLKDTVPVLIDILIDFVEHPENIESGELSGLQRFEAYDTLQTLTGAFYEIDDAENWRAFWEREKNRFEVVDREKDREEALAEFKKAEEKRKAGQQKVGGEKGIKTGKGRKKTAGTVANNFFGIPIHGSRIVFVLDVSGSMSLEMEFAKPEESSKKKWPSGTDRLEVAKAEIRATIEKLTEDVFFNIVTYHDTVKVWQPKSLVPATKKNKELAYKFLRKQSPSQNTNIYDGVAEALKISSLVYGERYEGNIDEMYLLSDGVPNRGAIRMDQDILWTINETNRFSKVRINTVFTGKLNDEDDPDERGMKLMKDLAAANNGRFIRP